MRWLSALRSFHRSADARDGFRAQVCFAVVGGSRTNFVCELSELVHMTFLRAADVANASMKQLQDALANSQWPFVLVGRAANELFARHVKHLFELQHDSEVEPHQPGWL